MLVHSRKAEIRTPQWLQFGNKAFPLGAEARGAFCACRWKNLSVIACAMPPPLSRGGLGIPESFTSSPEAPLQGELSAKQTERVYEGKPDREQKPLPKGEPFQLHDTAPLRWNKWRSSCELNDTSLNISCSPTWRSSPDWRSTYFASWAQVRHLGEVCFTALVR